MLANSWFAGTVGTKTASWLISISRWFSPQRCNPCGPRTKIPFWKTLSLKKTSLHNYYGFRIDFYVIIINITTSYFWFVPNSIVPGDAKWKIVPIFNVFVDIPTVVHATGASPEEKWLNVLWGVALFKFACGFKPGHVVWFFRDISRKLRQGFWASEGVTRWAWYC